MLTRFTQDRRQHPPVGCHRNLPQAQCPQEGEHAPTDISILRDGLLTLYRNPSSSWPSTSWCSSSTFTAWLSPSSVTRLPKRYVCRWYKSPCNEAWDKLAWAALHWLLALLMLSDRSVDSGGGFFLFFLSFLTLSFLYPTFDFVHLWFLLAPL